MSSRDVFGALTKSTAQPPSQRSALRPRWPNARGTLLQAGVKCDDELFGPRSSVRNGPLHFLGFHFQPSWSCCVALVSAEKCGDLARSPLGGPTTLKQELQRGAVKRQTRQIGPCRLMLWKTFLLTSYLAGQPKHRSLKDFGTETRVAVLAGCSLSPPITRLLIRGQGLFLSLVASETFLLVWTP